jgi:hypothetical protein
MANITTAEVNDSIPTIVAAEALGYLKANTVLAQLVARDWDDDVARYGQTVDITRRGALTVNDKAANTPVTLQTPADTKTSVTLNKHKEVSFIVEDLAQMFSRPNIIGGYIEDAMKVIAEQVDTDIAALYSGFSQTIDATGGLSNANFIEARRLLNAANAPTGDRFAVLHEDAEAEALKLEEIINRDYRGDDAARAMRDGFVGRVAGFDVFMDQKIRVAGGQCKNLFFHRNAIVLVTRPLVMASPGMGVVQRTMAEDGLGIRVTMSYDTDHLGWKVTLDLLYGVAELRDNHGVVVSTAEAA